jgi:hypothetical protein
MISATGFYQNDENLQQVVRLVESGTLEAGL